MTKQIATHNKTFHADEVTAVALLKVFTTDTIIVTRVDHNNIDFSKYNMVIDIGREFDGIKYFDHHQYRGGKSSAGLIWDYLGLQEQYPKISKLIKIVDDNDTGVQKASSYEYSNLIKQYNSSNIYDKSQDTQFNKAVEFAMTILSSMKKSQKDIIKAKDIVNNSYIFNGNSKILELEAFTPHWTTYINAQTMPHIKAVVWEDEIEHNWKVKIPSKYPGSFELNGKALRQDDSMEFVHSSGHFAIAKDENSLKKFLRKQIA